MDSFSSSSVVQGSQDFLNSNSLVAKVVFLILALIVFILLVQVGSNLLSAFFAPDQNPILIKGMLNAKQLVRIPQNPKTNGAIPIVRSQNEKDGIEFSWSVWIFVDDFAYKEHEYKHIFHKGTEDINLTRAPIGKSYPNNAPGLYLTPDVNNLVVIMNTYDKISEEVIVKDVPLNKWVNIIIRCSKQNQLDVYINGSLSKRYMLRGVPKQNYGDVFAAMNGGFSGYISDLRYFDSAIGTNQIQTLMESGPNLKQLGGKQDPMFGTKPQYLSNRWYFKGADDL
jgi:hypothetical protein